MARTEFQQLGVLRARRFVAYLVFVVYRYRVVRVEPDHTTILDEYARYAVYCRRNQKFVVESDVAGVGANLDVEVGSAGRSESEMPFADRSGRVSRVMHRVGERVALGIDD